jgi:hypothetical protein
MQRIAEHLVFSPSDLNHFLECQHLIELERSEDSRPMELGFARRLKDVVPRLELLGFTLEAAKAEYISVAEAQEGERDDLDDSEPEDPPDLMSFEEFCAFATAHSVQSLDDTFIGPDDDGSEDRVKGRFCDSSVTGRLPGFSPYDQQAYSERSYFGTLVDIIHPYLLLRVLACNSANLAGC